MIVLVTTRAGFCHRFRADYIQCDVSDDETLTLTALTHEAYRVLGVYRSDVWAMWCMSDGDTGIQMEGIEDGIAENEETPEKEKLDS